jgi:hypothetical protein
VREGAKTMLIKKADEIKSSEIADEGLYLNRRNFLRAVSLAGTVTATGWLYRQLNVPGREAMKTAQTADAKPPRPAAKRPTPSRTSRITTISTSFRPRKTA